MTITSKVIPSLRHTCIKESRQRRMYFSEFQVSMTNEISNNGVPQYSCLSRWSGYRSHGLISYTSCGADLPIVHTRPSYFFQSFKDLSDDCNLADPNLPGDKDKIRI